MECNGIKWVPATPPKHFPMILMLCLENSIFLETAKEDLSSIRLTCKYACKLIPWQWLNRERACEYVVITQPLQMGRYSSFSTVPELLQFTHSLGFPWDEDCTLVAAWFGNLECLQYLHTNGCPWDARCTIAAASGDHLECLQYAYESGCPWDERCTEAAAIHGHIKCLEYAHKNGCPWDILCTKVAATYGHIYCLKYADNNGCPCKASYRTAGLWWENYLRDGRDEYPRPAFINILPTSPRNRPPAPINPLSTKYAYLYIIEPQSGNFHRWWFGIRYLPY